jgi:hypothetical protein
MDTQIGRIVQLTKETAQVETLIRKELRRFIHIISAIAIGLGVLFFLLSVLLGKPFIASLIFAIGIIVANVPEGLLPTVTLALIMTSRRMAKKCVDQKLGSGGNAGFDNGYLYRQNRHHHPELYEGLDAGARRTRMVCLSRRLKPLRWAGRSSGGNYAMQQRPVIGKALSGRSD